MKSRLFNFFFNYVQKMRIMVFVKRKVMFLNDKHAEFSDVNFSWKFLLEISTSISFEPCKNYLSKPHF